MDQGDSRSSAAPTIRQVLATAAEGIKQPFASPDWAPDHTSPFGRDLSNAEIGRRGIPWGTEPVEFVAGYAGAFTMALSGHLHGIAELLTEASRSFLAAYALARVAVEGSASGWWLLEPGVSTRTRVERVYALRVAGLRETQRIVELLPGLPSPDRTKQLARLDVALQQAHQLGIPVHKQDGKPVGLKDAGEKAGTLVGLILEAGGFDADLASVMYPMLSGVVHSTPNALFQFRVAVEREPTPDQPGAFQMGVDSTSLELMAAMALLATLKFAERSFAYFGSDANELNQINDAVATIATKWR